MHSKNFHWRVLLMAVIATTAMAVVRPAGRTATRPAAAQGCATVADCAQQAVQAAQAAQQAAQNAVPVHTIIAWFQTSGAIPAGWAICDGTNGTPDLRGKFLQGVGTVGEVSPTPVGAATHQHTVTVSGTTGNAYGKSSYHVPGPHGVPPESPGLDVTYSFSATATTSSESNIPPSIRVIYLMKVQ